jgi:hypothetical protein
MSGLTSGRMDSWIEVIAAETLKIQKDKRM